MRSTDLNSHFTSALPPSQGYHCPHSERSKTLTRYEEKKITMIHWFARDVTDVSAFESLRFPKPPKKWNSKETQRLSSHRKIATIHLTLRKRMLSLQLCVLRTNHFREVCYGCDTFECVWLWIICSRLRIRFSVLYWNKLFRFKFWSGLNASFEPAWTEFITLGKTNKDRTKHSFDLQNK